MRGSVFASLALASGALLFSVGATAGPIHVGLLGASGNKAWTSCPVGGSCTSSDAVRAFDESPGHGTVSLFGWENDDGWTRATMMQNPDVPGLGIQCNGDANCSGYQIGSDPQQLIDLNISNLIDWTGLLITIDSVEGTNTGNLYGATCGQDTLDCEPTLLGSCTTVKGSCTLTLTSRELDGITDIWITPVDFMSSEVDPIVLGGSLYVCTGSGPCVKPTGVPEPAALGIFGLGLLLLGGFAGLRWRRTD